MKKTKVICTLGPSSQDKKTIKQLVKAGMNAARLNFSHGTYEQFQEIADNIRAVSEELGVPVAIIQDLQGPKIRIGGLPAEGIKIAKGEKLVLHTGEAFQEKRGVKYIPLQYKDLPKDIKKGEAIMVDDGRIELTTLGVNMGKTQIEVEAKTMGTLFSNKGINVPQTELRSEALTEKDLKDLEFGMKLDVDYVALSFVRFPEDIVKLKGILKENNRGWTKVISKIERPEAMENLEEIISESHAVMIARGDLGIEIPAENVPIAQKRIIREANRQGKPVITATHVLNSMVESPVPTRAEVSDAANAVFDHTDAIMLSNETAVGAYPVEACNVLNKVSASIETEMEKHGLNDINRDSTHMHTLDAISQNAVELSEDINAKFIVTLSKTGYTAQQVARRRPETEIIVFTNSPKTRNQLSLVWGISTIFVEDLDFENPAPMVKDRLEKEKLIEVDDEVVICNSVKGKKQRLITTFVG